MMLTITPADFRKLSDSCQRELLNLLGFTNGSEISEDDESIPYEESSDRLPDDYSYQQMPIDQEAPSGAKRVIDITHDQAKELISNISGKSIETLRRFATGLPIDLDDLIGEGRSYSSLTDLKRSFVGAVNRRLRTVTGNRKAVLFLTVGNSESRVMISVRQNTAIALRQVLL